MNSVVIPQNVLKCMRPEDRKSLGLFTPEEVSAKSEVKYEKALQNGCENYLRLNGIEFLHISHRAREKLGWPDLVFANPNMLGGNHDCTCNGQFCAVELKSATGKVSNEQIAVLRRLEANGANVAIIRTLTDFVTFVKGG